MKKLFVLLLSVALCGLTQQAFCQVDIDRCVQMAYENYPQIKEYDLIEMSRKYDLSNASMVWVPQLSVSGKASWQSAVVEMPFDIPDFKFNIPHDQYGITADVTQQIWDGGASSVKRKLVDAGAEVQRKQLDVTLYNIRSRVQNIYLSIILIDKQIELNDVLRINLGRNLEEVNALVENGVAYESDRDQIKVSILSCEQQKVALETDRKAYVRMLSLFTGAELQDVVLEEPVFDRESAGFSEIKRPEIALYDAQSEQVKLQRRQLSTAISPRLNFNLQAGYGRPGLNMLSGKFDPYMVAGLKLQWNFGSIYTLHNDRAKSDAEAARIETARRTFLLNTSMEALQKRSEIEKMADVLSRDGEIINLRKSIREVAERQYMEGVIKMNDYLGMLDDEFNARLNFNVHNVQYAMAIYDLQNTLGTENE